MTGFFIATAGPEMCSPLFSEIVATGQLTGWGVLERFLSSRKLWQLKLPPLQASCRTPLPGALHLSQLVLLIRVAAVLCPRRFSACDRLQVAIGDGAFVSP